MDQKKLYKILRDAIVSKEAVILAICSMIGVDYSVNQPLYRDVLDLQTLAPFLSLSMGILLGILAKVCAKLLVRGERQLFNVGITLFLSLMVFIFLGQQAAANMQASDPMAIFLDEAPPTTQSNRHYIATGLTIALFFLAVFIDYLVGMDEKDRKDDKQQLELSSLVRESSSKSTLLQGAYERALAKPTNIAEERVNNRIQQYQNNLNEYKRIANRLEGERSYQLQHVAILQDRTISAIEAVYSKQSLFKRFLTWIQKQKLLKAA